ncbi:GntR family transcriptional regulator [Effusibacillus dendaii]|uniref:GntR family transcriptional regulator n=1 Tax=Effusibacillus dendaii TaxID=2743772 RepID=A0A7I8D6E8_9BACL|nr:GntR family transcriptional regulator [Effusibacillus dendaii]BCJ85567.1 GntR family transcriptional regulator [Effusibacillus dendaii]
MENLKTNISKTQYAYEFIRSRIVDGSYGPGHRIVIDQIARELNLSAIPVREAIRQLESDGFIQYKPYSGAIVSMINETEYLETLSVLAVLEGYATALGSKTIAKEGISDLEKMNEEMNEALYNFEFEQFGELNRKFHMIIYECCGNSYLKEQIEQTWQRMARVRQSGFTFVPQRARESVEEHARIIEMMKERAPFEDIEAFARQHKLNTAKAFQNRKDAPKAEEITPNFLLDL